MRNRLALLLLTALILVAAGCSQSATDRDRDRVLAMIETLRPDVESALGDSLGEIEVTAVGEPEMKARLMATIRATSQEKLTRREFEERYARQSRFDLFGGQDDPATDVDGNLYFDLPGQPPYRMYAKEVDSFYLRVAVTSITFECDASTCTSLHFEQVGATPFTATR